MRKIPFSPPDIREEEINEVTEALRSGWITTGHRTKLFEVKLAEYLSTSKVVCLNSATAAMEMCLHILGVGEGDEVIVPSYTYTASASVITHVGAKIIMVDCSPGSFEMDYDRISGLITEKTKVIIPVDIGGRMCDYDKIFSIIESKKSLFSPQNDLQKLYNRVIVMSDSAHGLGAEYKGQKSGKVADFTTFSFHAVKNLTTAEGGAITWRDVSGLDNEWLYDQFMLYSLHGQNKDAFKKDQPGCWEYDIIYPAYKCNMADIAAAIGLKQLERYDDIIARRKWIIEKYNNAFKNLNAEYLVHKDGNITSSCHLYLIRINGINVEQRNSIITEMAQNGISCNVHYKPLPMMTAYKNLGFDIKNYPNAYNQYVNEITLPLNTCMTDEDVDYVIEKFTEIVGCC